MQTSKQSPIYRQCAQCKNKFEIFEKDKKFYKLFQVPEPQNCPDCRLIRRLQERNAKNLYYRTCSKSEEKILSQYHENQPFPVYAPKCWWSDDFDATETTGRDYDFDKTFFDQFLELKNQTPHCALFNTEGTMENSDYNNCTAYIKNCYLIAESDYCEDCYYSNLLKKCANLVDCSICFECELCYECVDCLNSYNLKYSQDCRNCQDSFFLKNCIGCSDCIGCINQRHKKFMIFNKQYSREEYEEIKEKMGLSTADGILTAREKAESFFKNEPHRFAIAQQNENSVGDHLFNSKNAFHCFDSKNLEDCRYCAKLSLGVKSSMDYNSWGNNSQFMYQCSSCGDQNYNCRFCVMCQTNMMDCDYCYECFSCQDCFGCVGLKKKKYCILNKQYTKEEYQKLKTRIIKQMQGMERAQSEGGSGSASPIDTKLYKKISAQRSEESSFAGSESSELKNIEFGEFFPIAICPFGYNETIAMDAFPLSREEAIAKGFHWKEESKMENVTTKNEKLPCCKICGKNYLIIPQEQKFYHQLDIPEPGKCPSCRHKERMARRNPLKLFVRKCSDCQCEIQTSYTKNEKILCEKCYQKLIYSAV